MAHVNPGREDNIYIGKFDKERKFVTRQYLLWLLNESLEILNGTNYLIEDPDSQKLKVLTSVLHTSTQIRKETNGFSVHGLYKQWYHEHRLYEYKHFLWINFVNVLLKFMLFLFNQLNLLSLNMA